MQLREGIMLRFIDELKTRGYGIPMRLQLLLEKLQGSKGNQGEAFLRELEIDRKNVFRCYYGEEDWQKLLTLAHEMFLKFDDAETTVEFILSDFQEGK